MRLEKMNPDRASDMAAELAHHFEAGSDWSRAVRYQEMVAANARRRFAHREAAAILEHALTLLVRLPETERPAREIAILQKLASTYDVLFDPRTVPTYEALAECAAKQGLVDIQVRALIDLALPMASTSSQRYLEVLERALRLNDSQEDPIARTGNRATCLVRRMAVAGWDSREAVEARHALEAMPPTSDRNVMASRCIDLGFLQSLSSEYRRGYRTANESIALLGAEGEENAYLSVAHWLSHRSLLYLGEWGKALEEIDAAITRSEKNGDLYRMNALCLNRGWVHFQAMDFEGVLQICRDVGRSFSSIGRCSCPRLCQVLAGSSEAALGRYDAALERLLAARDGMDREALIFDWCWRFPLDWSLMEVWLQRADLDEARLQGERFLESALKCDERTWQALAWESNARLAVAEGNCARARQCIAEALRVMKGLEVPLAAWRVHATASRINEMSGRSSIAAGHRALSCDTLRNLANSLPENSLLRATFLSSGVVTSILE
jgi:tetratricopeptide (TPR) repeat protein